MFLNSLGSFEVLRFTGQAERQTTFESDIVQRFLPHNYVSEDGEMAINLTTMQDKTNLSTGYFKEENANAWREYMKDFRLSAKIFDVTNGQRIRMVITSNNLPGNSDQDYLRFARFDSENAYIDDSYTPEAL
jgi:aromatic ring-opening dioxygenase LigB subunit